MSAPDTARLRIGVGLLLAGLIAANAWKQELTVGMEPGSTVHFAGYEVRMLSVEGGQGRNFQAERGALSFARGGAVRFVLNPERRFYPEREMQTTEAGVRSTLIAIDYAALGERSPDGRWTVRLYRHPLAIWIWLGAAIMALGGAFAWSDGRLRATFNLRHGTAPAVQAASP